MTDYDATLRAAKAVYARISDTAKAEHTAAWARVEHHVTTLASKPRGAKVFEVHHAATYARHLYLTEVARGLPADLAEKHVMSAYQES